MANAVMDTVVKPQSLYITPGTHGPSMPFVINSKHNITMTCKLHPNTIYSGLTDQLIKMGSISFKLTNLNCVHVSICLVNSCTGNCLLTKQSHQTSQMAPEHYNRSNITVYRRIPDEVNFGVSCHLGLRSQTDPNFMR